MFRTSLPGAFPCRQSQGLAVASTNERVSVLAVVEMDQTASPESASHHILNAIDSAHARLNDRQDFIGVRIAAQFSQGNVCRLNSDSDTRTHMAVKSLYLYGNRGLVHGWPESTDLVDDDTRPDGCWCAPQGAGFQHRTATLPSNIVNGKYSPLS